MMKSVAVGFLPPHSNGLIEVNFHFYFLCIKNRRICNCILTPNKTYSMPSSKPQLSSLPHTVQVKRQPHEVPQFIRVMHRDELRFTIEIIALRIAG